MQPRQHDTAWPRAIRDRVTGAAAQRMAQMRQRKQQQEQRINEQLAPLGLTLTQVIAGIEDGSIGVFIK